MSAYYDLYESPVPGNQNNDGEGVILHARPVGGTTHTTEELIKRISEGCTLTPADLKAVLVALSDCIASHLQNGDRVQLDGIGNFSVSLNCKKVTEAKDVHSHDVSFRHVNIQPAAELTRKVKFMKLYRTPSSTRKNKMEKETRLALLNRKLDEEQFITRKMYKWYTGISQYAAAKELEELVNEGALVCRGTHHAKFYYRNDLLPKQE